MTDKKTQSGYTLLFAVLTASLVLGVAAFVVGVARKQYIISATARDSMFSFYNADSAMNCIVQSETSSTTPTVRCNGVNGSATLTELPAGNTGGWPSGSTATTFNTAYPVYKLIGSIDLGSDIGCAVYNIWAGYSSASTNQKTIIEARGYNTCTAGGPALSRRTVERAIRVTQQ